MMSSSPWGEDGYTVSGRPNCTGLCKPPGAFTCSLELPPLGQQGWPDRMPWPLGRDPKKFEARNFGSELHGGPESSDPNFSGPESSDPNFPFSGQAVRILRFR